MEMVWGDDLVHLLWVGGSVKKTGGRKCVEICTFWTAKTFLRGHGQCVRDWER